MNALQFDHPVHESLLAFAQGRLDDQELARIEEHLRDCGVCRRTVEAAADDTLIVLLRSAATDSEGVAPLDVEDATNPPPLPLALMQHSRYRVQESLGAGGMGSVYKAEHLLMGRTVALKVIHPALVARPGAVERFVREARAAARLSHPNIVTAYDAEQVGGLHLLVMEYVEGVSLAHLVAAHGPLPVAEACRAIRQAALGLQHAHERGMVHRDIKPHNLMRTPDGRVKVLDFGLANLVLENQPAQDEPAALEDAGSPRAAGEKGDCPLEEGEQSPFLPAALTHADTIVGTPDYIAPEQARAAHTADIRADIYSLGCTLYFLLTGRPPFPEGNVREKMQAHQEATPQPIRELRPEAPPALVRVLDRLLAKDPEARYQTPVQVAQALAPFTKSQTKAARWSRWLGIAAAGVAAVLLAGVIVRVQTNKGTIIIQAADKQIETLIDQAGGVTVIDEATQHRYRLRPGPQDLQSGQYHIEVSDQEAGLHFDTPKFTLIRGGQVRLTASFVPIKRAGGLDAEAFAWFPDECRFFVGRNLRVHAGLSHEQLTILLQLLADAGWRERIWKLKSILGQVERITAAFAPDEKHPERGKIVIRITGRLNRPRLVDWFKTEFRDALEEGGANPAGTVTIFRNLQPLPVAAALVNDTDLVLGGYIGGTRPPVEVVREVMRVRAGRQPSAKPRYQFLIARVPENAWGIIAGDVPEPARRALTLLLTVLRTPPASKIVVGYVQWPGLGAIRSDQIVAAPKSVLLYLQGDRTTKAHFDAQFRTWQEAASFVDGLRSVQQRAVRFLKEAPALVPLTPAAQASWTKVLNGFQVERTDEHVRASVQIPEAAFQALTTTLQKVPLSSVRSVWSYLHSLFAGERGPSKRQLK